MQGYIPTPGLMKKEKKRKEGRGGGGPLASLGPPRGGGGGGAVNFYIHGTTLRKLREMFARIVQMK